ncbi:MAG: galactitol-1-phosphate 5-dehydrogenase [Cytophagales bacterium]|nr:galactitol-1-phosphate 5-dehydrogenase [Armatimonadota bacterium]
MNALLLTKYKHLELTDLPVPPFRPGEVLVRIRAAGICGSDVHGYDGGSGRRIPPLVMGHEAAGIVEEIGADVKRFQPGDRVTFDSTVYCGQCFFCHSGDTNLCDNRQVLGVSTDTYRRNGAFAEFVAVPERIVHQIPDSLTFERAALIEPTTVAVHAVNLTPVTLGDTAVVVGVGMIGLLAVQALRLAGCARVIAVDVDEAKLHAARGLGATAQINSKTSNAPAQILEMTDGRGADIVLEAVGAAASIRTAIESVRKGGTVTLIGNLAPAVEFALQSVVTRQIRLQGSCASAGEYPACIDLLNRGAILVDSLISAVAPLSEGPEWFERLYQREPNLTKVVLQP